jgi:Fe-Mn family superoxide dismutase
MAELQPKPLKYSSLPGLSEKQLSEHHDVLYAGYVKKTNEIRAKLANVSLEGVNATHSDLRELKLEETFALNGVKLHERYFDNLGGPGGAPSGTVADWIMEDFGSYEKWQAEFSACGMAARGWVVLAFDLEEKRLMNVVCDVHNQGGVWGQVPLLVLDVYEHAYFLDYATARKKYLETFTANVDWSAVNAQIEKFDLAKYRG